MTSGKSFLCTHCSSLSTFTVMLPLEQLTVLFIPSHTFYSFHAYAVQIARTLLARSLFFHTFPLYSNKCLAKDHCMQQENLKAEPHS